MKTKPQREPHLIYESPASRRRGPEPSRVEKLAPYAALFTNAEVQRLIDRPDPWTGYGRGSGDLGMDGHRRGKAWMG